jgi:hypothetical protein
MSQLLVVLSPAVHFQCLESTIDVVEIGDKLRQLTQGNRNLMTPSTATRKSKVFDRASHAPNQFRHPASVKSQKALFIDF